MFCQSVRYSPIPRLETGPDRRTHDTPGKPDERTMMHESRVVPGLAGARAVVTGGASGIGAACVELLEASGALVAIADRDTAPPVDVVVRSSLERLASEVGPRLDVLINAAGILPPNAPIDDITLDDARQSYEVNVLGTLVTCQVFARALQAARGAVVNLTSQAALVSLPAQGAYSASKGAVAALTRSLAIDWAERGVRVNAVAPGFTVTPMTAEFFENQTFVAAAKNRMPLGRLLEPTEIAGAIVFLASPLASAITGVVLPVDGGWTAGEPALPW
jgi:NAD(P)-dependent dehydrogenase (short-subunit alcohol dehydrogenase family)